MSKLPRSFLDYSSWYAYITAVFKTLVYTQNIVDKITKLAKAVFSIRYFTVGFLQFCNTTVNICLYSGQLATCHSKHLRVSLEFS